MSVQIDCCTTAEEIAIIEIICKIRNKRSLNFVDVLYSLLPEATIVDHTPWMPLATIGAVFTQYMWAGLSFSWYWQPEIPQDFWLPVQRETKSRLHILRKYGAYSRQRQPGIVVDYSCLRQRKRIMNYVSTLRYNCESM